MPEQITNWKKLDPTIPKYEVTPSEFFFDLVFVFAVSQLSHHLLAHLSWRGCAEMLVMLVAIFTVWSFTSWSAAIVRVDQSKTAWMVLVVMLPGLFMNASITGAFASSGWAFIIPLLLIQLGRTSWTLIHSPDELFREHFLRTLLWLIASSLFWMGGALANPDVRLLWWGLAAGIDLVGSWLAHPIPGRKLATENVGFDGDHMLERSRMFLLIALGETVFTTGTAIASVPITPMTLITGTSALFGIVSLWTMVYGHANRIMVQSVEETNDPIRASRRAVDALMPLVVSLILVAVANQELILHPHRYASAALSILLYGGPILFMLTQGWYLWTMSNAWPWLRLIGSAAMVLLGYATSTFPPYIALSLAAVTLSTLAIIDYKWGQQKQG